MRGCFPPPGRGACQLVGAVHGRFGPLRHGIQSIAIEGKVEIVALDSRFTFSISPVISAFLLWLDMGELADNSVCRTLEVVNDAHRALATI